MTKKVPKIWKFFSKKFQYIVIISLGYNCGFRPSPLQKDPIPGPQIPAFDSVPNSGEYFSEIKKIPTGFYIRQVYLNHSNKKEMLISQLTVSESKNWEETRFEGKLDLDESGKFFRFRPRLCRMFTSKNPGDRWTLTRAYECDHFEFLIWKSGPEDIRLTPGPEGEEEGILLKKSKSSSISQISAIILKTDSNITSIWGIRLSRVRKGAKAILEKQDGRKTELNTLKTVETTGEVKTERSSHAEPGDMILYTNPGEARPLAL
ncbi:hypothetical protein EHO58_01165 [Leptospira selangorensis]|uniref:hypothetical protein n=1 Tax=Leptospira selangorensis TaxID=2484982 RepID=UPI001083117E|nr:hypothetical protein [Leptospira selangorensis]TGK10622.1 hypothetical protein EHO58_01165 [Leptospira selangorensis]